MFFSFLNQFHFVWSEQTKCIIQQFVCCFVPRFAHLSTPCWPVQQQCVRSTWQQAAGVLSLLSCLLTHKVVSQSSCGSRNRRCTNKRLGGSLSSCLLCLSSSSERWFLIQMLLCLHADRINALFGSCSRKIKKKSLLFPVGKIFMYRNEVFQTQSFHHRIKSHLSKENRLISSSSTE